MNLNDLPEESPTETTGFAATYTPGEDQNRLAEAAKSFGLSKIRTPLKPVREALEELDQGQPLYSQSQSIYKFGSTVWKNAGLLFSDSTLAAARMHSVGYLAKEERVSRDGSLHLMSISKRRKGTKPSYGDLTDLFHQRPLEPSEVEVRETEDIEYEEVVIDSVEGGTLTAAVFGIIKGMVGPAVLYLPRGFATSGYGVAIPAMFAATLSYLYCSTRLLQAWKVESEKAHLMCEKMNEIQKLLNDVNGGGVGSGGAYGSIEDGLTSPSSSNAASEEEEIAPMLLTYPELARRAFGKYSSLISGGIAGMQFGVCLTYLIFVPQNLSESFRSLGLEVPKQALLMGMLALEIPLCWIRDIRKLAPINILATLFIAFGLASVLYIALFNGGGYGDEHVDNALYFAENQGEEDLYQEISQLPPIKDTWFLFIGTSFFCFEGSITLLVPLQEAVYSRQDRQRFSTVNNKVISSVVVFYMFFAIICWASFGDSVQTALTASLPAGLLSTAVQLAYSIAVIFTFPLQAFPALEVVMRSNGGNSSKTKKNQNESSELIKRNATASIIICLLGVVAVLAIDYLGNVVSLLGSLVGIPIALIYPPLIHNILVKDSSRATKMMNYCLSGIGLLAAGAASYTTISAWGEGGEG